MAPLIKENIELGLLAYSFRGSFHCHHGRKHSVMQVDTHSGGEGAD